MSITHPVDLPNPADPELYPLLSPQQQSVVQGYGQVRSIRDGELLFDTGERNAHFHLVLEGKIDILERRIEGDRVIAESHPGGFLGDTSMFTGQPTVAAGIARGPGKVAELEGEALRRLIAENSAIGDILLRTFTARRAWLEGKGYGTVRLIGSRWSPETFRLRDFMARNQVHFSYSDVESDEATRLLLEGLGVPPRETPVLICPAGVHRRPTVEDIATALGLRPDVSGEVFDVLVIGAGPAGLAAAVYGASEGLRTLIVDTTAPGGQAGTSSKIENYLGFPTGLSGKELAERAVLQARKFGATLSIPRLATGIECAGGHKRVTFQDGEAVLARSVVLATGASYRRLPVESCTRFEGRGVYYGATHTEALQCKDGRVLVIGGGNSAGQAAVFLSSHAREVRILIRRDSLASSMSKYLIDRIETQPNIHLDTQSSVVDFEGEEHLDRARVRSPEGERWIDTCAVFVMIGADPHTAWLTGCVGLDERGFVVTGDQAESHPDFAEHWHAPDRRPLPLETTRPGILAVGDVRSGSVKRVASGVGEGSMAVSFLHRVIAKAH